MSEEMNKKTKLNVFEIFTQTQQTYEESEAQAKLEEGRPKVDRFRISEDGDYSLRVMPLAPDIDENGNILPMERTGFQCAMHQFFLAIDLPQKADKAKKKTINIPVVRSSDKEVGYSADLIDTYVKIAQEMYGDDDDLMEAIQGGSYYGGLKWSYQHAMYVIDLTKRGERKGPQLWQCSHSQYRDINDAKRRLWADLRADAKDGEVVGCPISGFTDAYPINVIRKTTNKKTEYTCEIGRKTDDLSEDELNKLLELPRIPEQIYRFTRYQLEAEVEFLRQYDEKHAINVCGESDFKEVVERLKGELPSDDTSHFDLVSANNKGNSEKSEEVTVNSLWAELDAIEEAGLTEKSDEYQELREKIRQFVEDKDLDVRLTRSKTNAKLLEEIGEAMDELDSKPVSTKEKEPEEPAEKDGGPEDEPEENPKPRQRRPRPTVEEKEDEPEEEEKAEEKEPEEEPYQRPVRERRRR